MSVPRLAPGEILPLVRRLSGAPDPLALYAALADGGRRPDTLLLESADAATGVGQRSLLVVRSMLRLTCQRRRVMIDALSRNGAALGGRLLLDHRVMGRGAAGGVSGAPTPIGASGQGIIPFGGGGIAAPDLDERARLRAPGPLDLLRAAVFGPRVVSDSAPHSHLAAGIFSYDLVDLFERLPGARTDTHGFPEFVFWIPDRSILVDHLHRTTTIFALVVGGRDVEAAYHDAVRDVERLARAASEIGSRTAPAEARSGEFSRLRVGPGGGVRIPETSRAGECSGVDGNLRREGSRRPIRLRPGASIGEDLSDEEFAALVRRLQEHVAAGDVFQVVPSRTFTVGCEDPLGSYARLRSESPTPWQFFIRAPKFALLGASPEMAVRVEAESRQVTIRPIAGTAPRGIGPGGELDPELDARWQAALLTSPKELAEHLMLVDLARNDVARVSRPGTRVVSRLLALEGYRHVAHLVSEVRGDLADGLDALHAYAATVNMGTLVGAPKIRAAQLLRLHEPTKRGAYGGAVGFLTHDGALDTAIVIRAAYVREGTASVRAGAGVVLDSDPQAEAEETRHKAAAVLRALGAGAPA